MSSSKPPLRRCFVVGLASIAASIGIAASSAAHVNAQGTREIVALAATASGSALVVAVNDTASHLFVISPSSGHIVWQVGDLPFIASVAVAPDGQYISSRLSWRPRQRRRRGPVADAIGQTGRVAGL